jgi:hypothetical protein
VFDPLNVPQQTHLHALAAAEHDRLAQEHRKEALKQEYLKTENQREIARQKGKGKQIAKLDKKLSDMHPKLADAFPTSQLHGAAGIAARTVGDLTGAALYAPMGIGLTAKTVGGDFLAGPHHRPTATRELVKNIGKSTVEDVRHPLRHPGYTLLDALAVTGGVAGAAGRLGAAREAFAAAARTADNPGLAPQSRHQGRCYPRSGQGRQSSSSPRAR